MVILKKNLRVNGLKIYKGDYEVIKKVSDLDIFGDTGSKN